MATLLIRNADVLVTMDGTRREITGGGLLARDGVIEAVSPTSTLPCDADEIIEMHDGHMEAEQDEDHDPVSLGGFQFGQHSAAVDRNLRIEIGIARFLLRRHRW